MKNKIKKNPIAKFIFKYNKPKIEKNKKKNLKIIGAIEVAFLF